MKKSVRAALLSVLLAVAGPPAFSQDLARGEKADVAVLLDVSQSMFPWFEQAIDYVVGPLARDYLRFGDGFHILSFSDSVRLEYSTVLRTEAEARSALARLYLLYPLAARTDLVAAIEGARDFLATLGSESRKYAILVTDGYHNPAPGSPGAARSPTEVQTAIEAAAVLIREAGWKVVIVHVPFNGGTESGSQASSGSPGSVNTPPLSSAPGTASAPASGGPESDASGSPGSSPVASSTAPGPSPGSGVYLDQLADSLGASVTEFDGAAAGARGPSSVLPAVSWPADLGRVASRFQLPFRVRNQGGEPLELRVTSFRLDGVEALSRGASLRVAPGAEAEATLVLSLPTGTPAGRIEFVAEPGYADQARASPGRAPLTLVHEPGALSRLLERSGLGALSPLSLGLIAAALLLALIAALALRAHPGRRTDAHVVDAVLDANASRSVAARSASASRAVRAAEAQADADLLADFAAGSGAEVLPGRALKEEQPQEAGQRAKRHGTVAWETRILRPQSIRLELLVRDQNPNIGLRNVRTMSSGSRRSVGGGRSDFLVFLLPVPSRVAELSWDGERLAFVPKHLEFFPDLDGALPDCVDRDIRMLTRRGRELYLRFSRYEAPVERINRLLHCIDLPGPEEPGLIV